MTRESPSLFENALVQTLAERIGPSFNVTLTDNRRTLISIREKNGATHVRLSRIFALADEATTRGLVLYIKGRARRLPRSVTAFVRTQPPPPRAVRKAVEKLAPKGKVRDLRDVAGRIDKRYFGGCAGRVRITWGRPAPVMKKRRAQKSVRLGSYDWEFDLITVNPVLDSASVPVEVLELVVYHEMLHKKLGRRVGRDGRLLAHTPLFRALERKYERYEQAVDWERKHIWKALRPARGGRRP
ncbi:MAG: hypothetical protein ACNS63_03230 [Candidatus Nitrospinota bacterium M3_3B_026]